MTIFVITRRRIKGSRPDQVQDSIVDFCLTKEIAERKIRDILGEKAVCNSDWFWDVWTSPWHTNIEYFIEERTVITE